MFLQPAKNRSKTCILVKNLPAGTEKDEIKTLFEKHGHIARFLMPKHGITALIDFIEPFEAKKAFTKLAYSQFKHTPLYLEWAPENVFVKSVEEKTGETNTKNILEPVETSNDDTNANQVKDSKHNKESSLKIQEPSKEKVTAVDTKESHDAEEPENDTTLFVKNVNFKTTEGSLRSVSSLTISKVPSNITPLTATWSFEPLFRLGVHQIST